jgi:hypothetical protein
MMIKDLPWPPDGYFAALEISRCLLIYFCICVLKGAVSSTDRNIECGGYFYWKGRGKKQLLLNFR